MSKPICIIGTGYLGVINAIGLAELGCRIVGYDILPERIAALQQGLAPYREALVDDLLRKHIDRRRIRFTTDHADAIRGAGMILICVGTSSVTEGADELRDLRDCVRVLEESDLSACEAIVLRSTVPVGTSDRVAEVFSGRVSVAYAPEFFREGSAIADFFAPDCTVVGGDDLGAVASYAALFEPLGAPVMFTNSRNAELIKAASNAYLAVKLTFANEVAHLCEAFGADADVVLRGVGYDRRVGSAYLTPGLGIGNPSVEADVERLHRKAESRDIPFQLATAVLSANRYQRKRIVSIVTEELGQLHGRKIAVWGLAIKGGTDDTRDSPALRIIEDLVEQGAAVTAFDPVARVMTLPKDVALASNALAALSGADALLVLTDWAEFARISPGAIAHALGGVSVIDARNLLDAERISSAGLQYRGLGRQVETERFALPLAI